MRYFKKPFLTARNAVIFGAVILIFGGGQVFSVAAKTPDLRDKVDSLADRVKNVEAIAFKKLSQPAKDVAYLCELTGGEQISTQPKDKSGEKDKKAKDLKKNEQSLPVTEKTTCTCGEVSKDCDLTVGLEEVERRLTIENSAAIDTKARIAKAYTTLGYEDWQTDNSRFGIHNAYLVNPVSKTSMLAVSIAYHGYFSYRRFIPGNLHLSRRFSYFFAVGAPLLVDDSVKITTPVLSSGFGFDIVTGITLALGGTIYGSEDSATKAGKAYGAFNIGITLNTDLARAFKLF